MGREQEVPLHGDLLEAILSHVPLIDLVPASYVSKVWRRTISSSLSNPSRVKPWLMVHIQSPRNPSLTTARAYDAHSHVWIEITRPATHYMSPLRSSHSNLLYMLTPSKFSFSFDALNVTWSNVDAPRLWRSDPIVALIGSHVVIAGGTCDFEEDPLAVEIYDMKSRQWEMCQPMPQILKGSAATTWLSVAVSDKKMYLLEKNSGIFCSFDPNTKTWEGTFDIRPNPSVFFSVIGFSIDRLILVGLMGNIETVESLRIWEVNCDTFECKEIGKMPLAMLERLTDANTPLSSIGISLAQDFIYIYNPFDPKEIIFCEFTSGGICQWGNVHNSIVNYDNRMDRFMFTCSKVGIDDLRRFPCRKIGNSP